MNIKETALITTPVVDTSRVEPDASSESKRRPFNLEELFSQTADALNSAENRPLSAGRQLLSRSGRRELTQTLKNLVPPVNRYEVSRLLPDVLRSSALFTGDRNDSITPLGKEILNRFKVKLEKQVRENLGLSLESAARQPIETLNRLAIKTELVPATSFVLNLIALSSISQAEPSSVLGVPVAMASALPTGGGVNKEGPVRKTKQGFRFLRRAVQFLSRRIQEPLANTAAETVVEAEKQFKKVKQGAKGVRQRAGKLSMPDAVKNLPMPDAVKNLSMPGFIMNLGGLSTSLKQKISTAWSYKKYKRATLVGVVTISSLVCAAIAWPSSDKDGDNSESDLQKSGSETLGEVEIRESQNITSTSVVSEMQTIDTDLVGQTTGYPATNLLDPTQIRHIVQTEGIRGIFPDPSIPDAKGGVTSGQGQSEGVRTDTWYERAGEYKMVGLDVVNSESDRNFIKECYQGPQKWLDYLKNKLGKDRIETMLKSEEIMKHYDLSTNILGWTADEYLHYWELLISFSENDEPEKIVAYEDVRTNNAQYYKSGYLYVPFYDLSNPMVLNSLAFLPNSSAWWAEAAQLSDLKQAFGVDISPKDLKKMQESPELVVAFFQKHQGAIESAMREAGAYSSTNNFDTLIDVYSLTLQLNQKKISFKEFTEEMKIRGLAIPILENFEEIYKELSAIALIDYAARQIEEERLLKEIEAGEVSFKGGRVFKGAITSSLPFGAKI